MNQLQVFKYGQDAVRTVTVGGEPWFVLNDVCGILGIDRFRIERLDEDEWIQNPLTDALGRPQQTYFVSESGLYSVILRSDKPEARKFRKWVTADVLPSIRKHKLYATEDLLANPDLLIQAATALKAEREKSAALIETVAVQSQQIAEMKPKACYYDLILQCKGLTPITVIAKDYGKSGAWFNEYLHEIGIQYKVGKTWVLYQQYAQNGYTQTKTHEYVNGKTGEPGAKPHMYWTQKGRLFLYDILKTHGLLPRIETDVNAEAAKDFEEATI